MNFEQWKNFNGGKWQEEIDVRSFIQLNYTPYEGNDEFLQGPTESTKKLWDKVLKLYKKEIPYHNIWIYSGFTYEEILNDKEKKELLMLCDVLVDGLYKEELRDITLKFRGSSNQRIINIDKI